MIEEEKRVGLPQDWQRAGTLNGSIPYYINHDTETTQWDHPDMTQLMTDLSGVNDIKYAAYRTAVKLRAIEKKTQLYSIDLNAIRAGFNDLGYSESFSEDEIDVPSLEGVLTEIFSYQSDKSDNINVAEGVELTLNWLLNVYDQARSGALRILSVKIGLTCLSVASVQEKYKYIFHQLSSSKGFINKKRLRVFLNDALQILKYIKEYSSFGKAGVEPAVQSCFERAYIPERICLQEFLDWMIAEPQTVVWLPTLHRLALSETVKHEGKCNICKMFPIVGFRYRCLKCFNFDMCQSCFWSGRISKNHKLTHQTQEYCLPATQTEDIKDFAKVVKSKVRKKKKKNKNDPSKGRFLPIPNDITGQASDEENSVDYIDYGDAESTTSFESQLSSDRLLETEKNTSKERQPTSPSPRPVMDDEHQLISFYSSCLNGERQPTTSTPIQTLARLDRDHIREMDEIVENLEDDNRFLREKILEIQDAETQMSIVQTEEREHIKDYNERLEAKQEVLEDHNRRLEDQLAKLRVLIQQEKHAPPRNNISIPRPAVLIPRSENTTNRTFQSIARHPFQYHDREHYSPFSTANAHYDGQTQPFPKVISKDIKSGALDYSLSRPKQNTMSSSKLGSSTKCPWDSINEENFKDPSVSDVFGATLDSTTSNDDLRAIEEGMERLLASDTEEALRKKSTEEEPEFEYEKLQDSDSSFCDEQQSYLLTAASMVGEAVEDIVINLSGEKTRWKYLELDFTDDEDEI